MQGLAFKHATQLGLITYNYVLARTHSCQRYAEENVPPKMERRNAIKHSASGSIHACIFITSSSPHGLTSRKFLPLSPVVPSASEPKMNRTL